MNESLAFFAACPEPVGGPLFYFVPGAPTQKKISPSTGSGRTGSGLWV